ELKDRLLSELKEIAEDLGVKNFRKLSKQDLIYKILDQQAATPPEKLPKKIKQTPSAVTPEESPTPESTTNEQAAPAPAVEAPALVAEAPVPAPAPAKAGPVAKKPARANVARAEAQPQLFVPA